MPGTSSGGSSGAYPLHCSHGCGHAPPRSARAWKRRAEADYERRKGAWVVYEPAAGSCAGLLWRHLHDAFGYRKPRHAALVRWAEKTDAARYDTVEEAIESTAPALRINASLAAGEREGYGEFLVRALRRHDLDEVAELPEVRTRFDEFQQRLRAGLHRFEQGVHLEEDGIVVFDVAEGDAIISRYAPYLYFRDARHSVGIVRRDSGSVKITAMRNPWRDFESVHLGKIFEPYGGGGHQRVAAVVLRDEEAARAEEILAAILTDVRSEEIGEIRRTA